MSLRLRTVQLDVPADAHEDAVAFWAAALGAREARSVGDGTFVHLVGPRSLVGVHLQRQGEGPARVHLDLDADDPGLEVERLVGLGATRLGDGACAVLQDPGGNLLCVCAAGDEDEVLVTATGTDSRLHVLVVDVAADAVEATARFWGAALGIEAEHLPAPYDAYWRLEDVPVPGGAMRVLVQALGSDTPARIHLDLHVPDADARDREVGRLVDLGAQVLQAGEFPWTVLRDPVGTVLCVVPDA